MVKKVVKKESKPKELLNSKFYKEKGCSDIYSDEIRIGKVFGVENKKSGETFIRAVSQSKRPYGWTFNNGFDVYNILHLNKLSKALRKIASKLGWKVTKIQNMAEIKTLLRQKEERIIELQKENQEARESHEALMFELKKKQDELLQSKIPELRQSLTELKHKADQTLSNNIPEDELQEFLFKNTWLLGTEYISAEPQKMRGAHSRFDFYLERFNKTKDIVEIKLISDKIVNNDGTISAKVIQAVDQVIEYLETATAAAHSKVIAEEEGIDELRPRGVVIIGDNHSPAAKEKLHKWNFRMSNIRILTYRDIILRGEALLKHVENKICAGEQVKT